VIEGEGLGGFARRLTVNVGLDGQFLPPPQIFSVLPELWNRQPSGFCRTGEDAAAGQAVAQARGRNSPKSLVFGRPA
jgi:hypothetical protein